MRTRVISAIVALIILIPIFYIGGPIFNVATYVITILGFREFIKVRDRETPDFIRFISYLIITFMFFEIDLAKELNFIVDYRLLSGLFIAILLPVVLYHNEKKYNINDAFYLLSGILFLGLSIPLFCLYRNLGLRVIIYLLSITLSTDTYAYIVGSLIGKHKLLEDISPRKTIEGLIGGIIVGTFIGAMFFITVITLLQLSSVIILQGLMNMLSADAQN